MERIIIALFLVLLTCSVALADWSDAFLSDYTEKGMGSAVTNALRSGISPGEIIVFAKAIEGVKVEEIFRALCEAGVPLKSMLADIEKNNINLDTAITACAPQEDVSPEDGFPGMKPETTLPDYDGGLPVSGHKFQ